MKKEDRWCWDLIQGPFKENFLGWRGQTCQAQRKLQAKRIISLAQYLGSAHNLGLALNHLDKFYICMHA